MIDATLVLEGGAKRGVFTAGALDYLMEANLFFSCDRGIGRRMQCDGLYLKTDWTHEGLYDTKRT